MFCFKQSEYNRSQNNSVSPNRGYGSNTSTPHSNNSANSYENGPGAALNGGYGSPATNMTTTVSGSPGIFSGKLGSVNKL